MGLVIARDFQIFQKGVEIEDRRSADDDVAAELFVDDVNGPTFFVGDAPDDEDDDLRRCRKTFFTSSSLTKRLKPFLSELMFVCTLPALTTKHQTRLKQYKKTVVIQNKSNSLLKIFCKLFLHYNY
jgi:hypothetical protein